MTNDELNEFNNTKTKILLDYNCDYYATEIGILYNEYKTFNQGQLQKALLKCSTKIKQLYDKKVADGFKAVNQSIFKLTYYNTVTNKYETPKTLLQTEKTNFAEFNRRQKIIFDTWYEISQIHLNEMNRFYQERKINLEQQQKINHIIKANEKVECSYCNASVARTNLSRHYKTNKTCLSLRLTNDDPH